jgi:Fe-S-cluster containining protein
MEIVEGSIKMENETEKNKDNENSDEQKKESGKYVFECQKCGQCCESTESVSVSLADLNKWSMDMTLPSLYQFLTIELKGENYIQISLKQPESPDLSPKIGCPLYDKTNKICNIYFSMPLFCNSYPLGYDGNNFYLKDKTCKGLNKGQMTQKKLKEARKAAKEDFEARVFTSSLLPLIHGLTMGFILEQSKKQMDELTDDQKNKLNEILGKEKRENKDSESTQT